MRRALKLDGTWHQTGLSLAFLRRSGSRLRRQAALYLFGKKSHIIDIEAAIQVFHKITPYYKGCHSLLRVAPSPQLRLTTCSQRVSSPKSYEHNPSPAKQVSLGEPHTSIPLVPKGLLFPKKAGGHSTRSIQGVTGIRDGVPPAARATWKQAERGAQRPDRKRRSQLMLGV